MSPSQKTINRFRLFGSPLCVGFGLLTGSIYALLVYEGYQYEAFIGMAISFFAAGIMGCTYGEYRVARRDNIPFYVEQMRLFYFLFFLAGPAYYLRSETVSVPDQSVEAAVSYFLTGSIAGTVLMMGLFLFIGIKYDIALWNVVRFPVWIIMFFRWIAGLFRRG